MPTNVNMRTYAEDAERVVAAARKWRADNPNAGLSIAPLGMPEDVLVGSALEPLVDQLALDASTAELLRAMVAAAADTGSTTLMMADAAIELTYGIRRALTGQRYMFSAKFQMGQVLVTPGAGERIKNRDILAALMRHANGDWGAMPPEDAEQNDALIDGLSPGRLMSAYPIDPTAEAGCGHEANTFWIITTSDRSNTTVLLPEEY